MPTDSYHETRVPEIHGVIITLSVIATILTALRVLSRRIIRAQLWWDDWTIFLAMVSIYRLLPLQELSENTILFWS